MRTKIDVRTRKNLRETVNFFGNTDETDGNIDKWQGAGKLKTCFRVTKSQEPGRQKLGWGSF